MRTSSARLVDEGGARRSWRRLDDLVALQRDAAGPAYDEAALRLGLLAGLTWLGWNKALDIVEHPDPAVRERERVALTWWLHQAELAFETGLI